PARSGVPSLWRAEVPRARTAGGPAAGGGPAPAEPAPAEPELPWDVGIAKLELTEGTLRLRDPARAEPNTVGCEQMTLRLDNFSTVGEGRATLGFDGVLASGKVAARGELLGGARRAEVALEASGIDLPTLQHVSR